MATRLAAAPASAGSGMWAGIRQAIAAITTALVIKIIARRPKAGYSAAAIGASNAATAVVRIIREPLAWDRWRLGIRIGIDDAKAVSWMAWQATRPKSAAQTSHSGSSPTVSDASDTAISASHPILLASRVFFGPHRSASSPPTGAAVVKKMNV